MSFKISLKVYIKKIVVACVRASKFVTWKKHFTCFILYYFVPNGYSNCSLGLLYWIHLLICKCKTLMLKGSSLKTKHTLRPKNNLSVCVSFQQTHAFLDQRILVIPWLSFGLQQSPTGQVLLPNSNREPSWLGLFWVFISQQFVLQDRISLCRFGCAGITLLDQASLKLRNAACLLSAEIKGMCRIF